MFNILQKLEVWEWKKHLRSEDFSEFQFSSKNIVAHLDKCLAVAFFLLIL